MKRTVVIALALGLGMSMGPAMAVKFGDPAAGKKKASACAACHGSDGNSGNPAFPKIAGQHADYLLHSLKAYKSGDRKNAIMNGQAANLSVEDMEDLAAYFSSLESNLSVLVPRNSR